MSTSFSLFTRWGSEACGLEIFDGNSGRIGGVDEAVDRCAVVDGMGGIGRVILKG